MTETNAHVVYAVVIGVGATAFTDLFNAFLHIALRVPAPNYRLVGRWLAYMPRGRFRHAAIAASAPIPGERVIGWTTHYAIGVAFAAILLAIHGLDWARDPTPGPALVFGLATVAAPFLVMQPCMGAGIAASRSPAPWKARLRSVANHGAFGLGLYLAAWAASRLGW